MDHFRIKAFITHLSISISTAIGLLILFFVVWYPNPLDNAVGVTKIVYLMLAVDAILGPMMTLLVSSKFKKKKLLILDYMFIVFFQVTALSYGCYNVLINRPVYIAFDQDRFDLILASDLDDAKDDVWNYIYEVPKFHPKFISVKPIVNDQDRNERLFYEIETGKAPSMRPQFYIPIEENKKNIIAKSMPLQDLKLYNNPKDVAYVLEKSPSAIGWLPLKATKLSMVVLVDSELKFKIVDLRPWSDL